MKGQHLSFLRKTSLKWTHNKTAKEIGDPIQNACSSQRAPTRKTTHAMLSGHYKFINHPFGEMLMEYVILRAWNMITLHKTGFATLITKG